jgi:hypothetical protein
MGQEVSVRRLLLCLILLAACEPEGDGFGGQQPPDPEDPTPAPPILSEETTLVTVDETLRQLLVIDSVDAGTRQAVDLPDGLVGSCSTVFTRGGEMYLSLGVGLVRWDPCTTDWELVGEFTDGAQICGIASRGLIGLYGIERTRSELVRISMEDASLTTVGETGVYWAGHGLTFDEENERFLAITGDDDTLHSVDPETGEATWLADLDHDFYSVGIEVDPVSGTLFACTRRDLLAVDIASGHVTVLGELGEDENCADLGATYLKTPCLD